MKPLFLLVLLITFPAIPAFAQDGSDVVDGGSDGVSDFSAPEGPVLPTDSGPKVDGMADLRRWMEKAGAAPIDKTQEKPLNELYNREFKFMQKSFQTMFGISLQKAIAGQSSKGQGSHDAQVLEIRSLSDHLMDQIVAALRMDQQAALRKYQSDQFRLKRKSILQHDLKLAGLTLTRDQMTQVDELYARESRIRALAFVEAKGESVSNTLTNLEKQTSQRILDVLSGTQRSTLSTALAKAKTP